MATIHNCKSKLQKEYLGYKKLLENEEAQVQKTAEDELLNSTLYFLLGLAIILLAAHLFDPAIFPLWSSRVFEKMPFLAESLYWLALPFHVFKWPLILWCTYRFLKEEVFTSNHHEKNDQKLKETVGILGSGVEGEQKALDFLKALPDHYHVFNNCVISYDGKESETDLIVVGPTGVFAIEVKNYNGKICGDVSDETLRYVKPKYADTDGTRDIYNPFKQVRTHVWRLSKNLQKQNIHTWIEECVWFVHDAAELNLTNHNMQSINLFDWNDRQKLLDLIVNKKTSPISNRDVARIADYLQHCQA